MVARDKRESAPPLEIQRIFAQPEGVRRSGSTSEGLLLNLLRRFSTRSLLRIDPEVALRLPWLLSSAPPGHIPYYCSNLFVLVEIYAVIYSPFFRT